jgi:hypothetical protein
MWFLFPLLVICILLWILFTWTEEKKYIERVSPPQISEPEKKQEAQKRTALNKEQPYLRKREKTLVKTSSANACVSKNKHDEHPHDHQEHSHDMPNALRPRRMVMRKPEEDEEESTLKKSVAIQTDEDEEQIIASTPKTSVGTSWDAMRWKMTALRDSPAPRASIGIQTDQEKEDIGIQTEPPVARPPSLSESEEESESFESYPLKPKYLSSPSQSEEEESELSSNARRERYSIIQPFMSSRKESEEE